MNLPFPRGSQGAWPARPVVCLRPPSREPRHATQAWSWPLPDHRRKASPATRVRTTRAALSRFLAASNETVQPKAVSGITRIPGHHRRAAGSRSPPGSGIRRQLLRMDRIPAPAGRSGRARLCHSGNQRALRPPRSASVESAGSLAAPKESSADSGRVNRSRPRDLDP